jgi:hypothetical protein
MNRGEVGLGLTVTVGTHQPKHGLRTLFDLCSYDQRLRNQVASGCAPTKDCLVYRDSPLHGVTHTLIPCPGFCPRFVQKPSLSLANPDGLVSGNPVPYGTPNKSISYHFLREFFPISVQYTGVGRCGHRLIRKIGPSFGMIATSCIA